MAKKTTAKQNTNNGESKFKRDSELFYQRADPFYYRIGYFHCYHICRSGIDFVFLYGRGGSEQDREYPVVGPGDQSWISRELDGGARGLFLPIC